MRYLMKFSLPHEPGNDVLADPKFGEKMQDLLKEIKAEAVYFTTIDGQRGGYAVVNMNEPSDMALIAEPFFYWLKSDIEFLPVMKPEDLMKAGPAIAAAVKKWGA